MLKSKSTMDKSSPKESVKGGDNNNSENESIGDETASISTTTTSRSKSPGSRKHRRSRSTRSSKTKVNRPSYKYDCHLKEDHGQAIFGVAFNYLLGKNQPLIFATAGSNRCSVYECPPTTGLKLLLFYLSCYAFL